MNKKSYCLVCFLFTALVLFSFKQTKNIYRKGWIDFNKNGKKDIYDDASKPVEASVNDLLRQMTIQEKTCQLTTLYGYGTFLKDLLPEDS